MVIKFRKSKPPIKSLSLSLSLSHTHIQPHSLRNLVQICLQKTWTEKKLLRTLKTILFAFTVAIVLGKYFENNTKKMANMKNLTMGEMRLLFIHTRVQYLCLNYLDEENMDEFKYKPLCDYCEMKLDMSGGKRGNELEVTPSCKTLFVQCSGIGWLCRARQRLINATHIHWESEGQMTTKKIYKMILMHILKNQQPKDALYNIEHFNLELTKKMPHLIKTTQLAAFLIYSNYIPFQLTEGIFPVPPIGE